MAAGDIVYARVPLDVDISSAEDSSVTTVLAGLFPIATYDVIHTTIIPPTGTKTKAVLIVVAQAIT
jgi:hypothetical protein